MRRMTLPGTHLRPVESANAMSRSRPVALTKSPKKCMMRYDRSSVTLAMKSEVHGASVAQVPASVTWSRQSPTSTAQTLVAHMPHPQSPSRPPICRPCRRRKQQQAAPRRCPAASRSIASTLQTPVNCRAERGRSYAYACQGGDQCPLVGWACAPGTLTYPH